jgi:hypothetical protein
VWFWELKITTLNIIYKKIEIIYLTSLPARCKFAADHLIHKTKKDGNERKNGLCTAHGDSHPGGFGKCDCCFAYKKCGIARLER